MVGVAKWITHRIVAPAFVGSIPITHPKTQSSDNGGEVTPVPIPNTEVKLSSADGTWAEAPGE